MRAALAFIHVLGAVLWIGGALAAMVLAVASRGEPPAVRLDLYRLLGRVYGILIGPGVIVVLLSGIALVMLMVGDGLGARLGVPMVSTMMGTGTLGGLIVLFVVLPTAHRLAALRLEDGSDDLPPAFARLRRRLATSASIAGVLALVALYAGVVGV